MVVVGALAAVLSPVTTVILTILVFWVFAVRRAATPLHVLGTRYRRHGNVTMADVLRRTTGGGARPAIGTLFVFNHLYVTMDCMLALSEMEQVWGGAGAWGDAQRFAFLGANAALNHVAFYAWVAARGVSHRITKLNIAPGRTVASVVEALRTGRHVVMFTEPYRQHQTGVWAAAVASAAPVVTAALHPDTFGAYVGQVNANLCVAYRVARPPAAFPSKHEYMHHIFSLLYGPRGTGDGTNDPTRFVGCKDAPYVTAG